MPLDDTTADLNYRCKVGTASSFCTQALVVLTYRERIHAIERAEQCLREAKTRAAVALQP